LQEHGFSIDTAVFPTAQSDRYSPISIARRVFQGVGGGACVGIAALMPWTEFSASGIAFGSIAIPMTVLMLLGVTVSIGCAFFAASVWGLVRRLPRHTRLGVVFITLATAGSLAGFEYGYLRPDALTPYEYRAAVRMLCYALGIALLACSVPEELGQGLASYLRKLELKKWQIIGLALMVAAAGAVIGGVVLDGMPHMIDGTSYLLEARTLWSGHLAIDPPAYPELFAKELIQFRTTDAGYFSKYPTGWPAILGGFDAVGLPWLANALLAGILVLLTYAVVAERGSKRLAGVAALAAAMCPWLWFNAGTMMSHLASAVWLWLFLWLFIRTIRLQSRGYALLSGLALGCAVLTRPADAAFFALPCVVTAIAWTFRRPDRWLTRFPLVAAGALPGVVAYLLINAHLSGTSGDSTYGGGHSSMLFNQTPDSVLHAFAWLHESWVGMNTQWFAGAMPLAMLVICGAVFGRHYLRGHWLVIACSLSLFLCYSIFVFGGRAWVGPRWYVPLIPAMAVLIAAGIKAAAHAGRVRSPGGVLAAGYLRASLVALVVVFAVALPARIVELLDRPPHGIDGRVVQLVEEAGLTNAVVALPAQGLDPQTGQPNYKRGIAGMWAMQTPFEDSDVIYIAAVDGWQQMATDAWPGRALYTMTDTTGDMRLIPIDIDSPTLAEQTR